MLAILVSLYLAVSGSPSSAPQPTQSVEKQAQPTEVNTAANPQGSPETNPPVEKEKSKSDQRAGKKENKEAYEQGFMERMFELVREHDAEVVAISTAIIAAFTIALSLVTFLLWFGGERLSQRELRAYVSVTPKNAILNKDSTRIVGVNCMVKNHGKTPAFKVNYVFGISILPIGSELPHATMELSLNAAVFPDVEMSTHFFSGKPFTREETNDVGNGTRRFHFWGIATYRDAFKKRRTTKFNASMGGPDFAEHLGAARGRYVTPPNFRWVWEDGHNEAT
jgi:hypothetical protein